MWPIQNQVMKNLPYFLKELNLLREKYLIANERGEQFNIFTTLLDPYNSERGLHSRFMSSLLDPKGNHHLGTTPIELLFGELGSKMPITPHIEVIPNNETWAEHANIDLLIIDRVARNALIIENKINARDSNHSDRGQLEGYYQQILSEGIPADNIEIYYLTLDRHEPSPESLNTNGQTPELESKVQCIDYGTEIKNWLSALVKEAFCAPFLRESVNQYINLINNMTGNIEIEERLELMRLVGKNRDNLVSAKLLMANFKHICWHTIDSFNRELQKSLSNKKIEILEAPDTDTIDRIVHGGPKQRNVCFYYLFKGKEGLTWTMQADPNDANGFYVGLDKQTNKQLSKGQKENIKDYVAKNNLDNNKEWYYWKYLAQHAVVPALNLWDFLQPNSGTFDLISESSRKSIIESYVKSIKQEINQTF